MNWNPAYSYATIPAAEKNPPAVWKVLATPVPRAQGIAHFHDVKIWNIKASGATTAFEVDGYPEAPLLRFAFDNLDIAAASGGHINDAKDWTFARTTLRLGRPVEVSETSSVTGLPAGTFDVRKPRPKEDAAKKSFEEQDKT